jgi:hypothetical protein
MNARTFRSAAFQAAGPAASSRRARDTAFATFILHASSFIF